LGALILFISANTGIVGSSRLTYYLSKFGIISPWFDTVHPKYKTPIRTILVFSGIGAFETILSFLTPSAMDTLANMYAFGATLGYTMVFIALIKLRFSEPWTPRPYKMPLNIKLKLKGRKVLFPVLGVIGTLGVSTILFMVVLTHDIGRIAGPAWVLFCFGYYAWYRKSRGLPIFRSIDHNWEQQQMDVLNSAEEFDLLEQYKLALAERDKKRVELK
jgi:APA family basic amino acid/polyamine antiporter